MNLRKKIVLALGLSLLTVVILIGLTPTLVNWGVGQGALREAIATNLNGTVDLGEVHVGWGGSQQISGLAISDTSGRTVATLDLELEGGLAGHLFGGFASLDLAVSGTVNVALAEDGTNNLTSLFLASQSDDPADFPLERLNVQLRDLTLTLHDDASDEVLTIKKLSGELVASAGGSVTAKLSGQARSGDRDGSFEFSGGLDGLIGEAGALVWSRATLDGRVTASDLPILGTDGSTLEQLELTFVSSDLTKTLDLTIQGDATIEQASTSHLEGVLNFDRPFSATGEANLGLDRITGTLRGSGMPTALLQPLIASFGLDAQRDLGDTADLTADFSTGLPKSIDLTLKTPRLSASFKGTVDPGTRRVRGTFANLFTRVDPGLAASLANLYVDESIPVRIELTTLDLPPSTPGHPFDLGAVALKGTIEFETNDPLEIRFAEGDTPGYDLRRLNVGFETDRLEQGLELRGDAIVEGGVITFDERVWRFFGEDGGIDPRNALAEGTTTIDNLPGALVARHLPEMSGIPAALFDESCSVVLVASVVNDRQHLDVDFTTPGLKLSSRTRQEPDAFVLSEATLELDLTPQLVALAQGERDDPMALSEAAPIKVTLDEHRFAGDSWASYEFRTTPIRAYVTSPRVSVASGFGLVSPVELKGTTADVTYTPTTGVMTIAGGSRVDHQSARKLIVQTSFKGNLNSSGEALSYEATIDLTDADVAVLETVLDRPAGSWSRWTGGSGTASVTVRTTDAGLSAHLVPSFPALAGDFEIEVTDDIYAISGQADRLVLPAGTVVASESVTTPANPTTAATRPLLTITDDTPLVARIDQLRVPRAMLAGESFDPADFAMQATITGGPVLLSDAQGATFELRTVEAIVSSTSLAESIDFDLKANQATDDATTDDELKGIRIEGQARHLLDEAGAVKLAQAAISLDATIEEAPTALIDAMLNQQGLLVAALGPVMAADISVVDFSATGGTLDARIDTRQGWLEVGLLGIDGVARTREDTPLKAQLTFSEPLRQRLLQELGPFVADIRSAAKPIDFDISNASFPLDGDLTRLDADVRVDIGDVEFDSGSTTLEIFSMFDVNRETTIPGRIDPIRATIREGLITYEPFNVVMDKYTLPISGTINLVTRHIDMRTIAPMEGLAQTFRELQEVPGLEIPLVMRGTLGEAKLVIDPEFDLGGSLLEVGLQRVLGELFKKIDR